MNLKNLLDGFQKNVQDGIPTELRFDGAWISLTCQDRCKGCVGIVKFKKEENQIGQNTSHGAVGSNHSSNH